MSFISNWILKPELLPAWLQAGAAIVALVISVWAVLWAGAATRRRDRLEKRGLAVAIYPEIEMLAVSTQDGRRLITALKDPNQGLLRQNLAGNLEFGASIPLPPMIERNIDKLFIIGDVAGPSCLHLVRLLIQYNTAVEATKNRIMNLSPDKCIEALDQLEQHLALLDKVIAKCKNEVGPIHDAING